MYKPNYSAKEQAIQYDKTTEDKCDHFKFQFLSQVPGVLGPKTKGTSRQEVWRKVQEGDEYFFFLFFPTSSLLSPQLVYSRPGTFHSHCLSGKKFLTRT